MTPTAPTAPPPVDRLAPKFEEREFEIFLEREFFWHHYDCRAYEEANRVWKDFLVGTKPLFPHRVVKKSLEHRLMKIGPTVVEDSAFVATSDGAFKDIMLYGMEGSLMLLYIVVFACLDMTLEMPTFAGMIVVMIDAAIVKFVKSTYKKVLTALDMCDVPSLIR
jgi:hypothetical protein